MFVNFRIATVEVRMDKTLAMNLIDNMKFEVSLEFNSYLTEMSEIYKETIHQYVDIFIIFENNNKKCVISLPKDNKRAAREILMTFLDDCNYLSFSDVRGRLYNFLDKHRELAEQYLLDHIADGSLITGANYRIEWLIRNREEKNIHRFSDQCIQSLGKLQYQLRINQVSKCVPVELEKALFEFLAEKYTEADMINKWKMVTITGVINT